MKKVHLSLRAELCKTFAHSSRLEILSLLDGGEVTAGTITRSLGISKANTAQHLALMRAKGLVKTRRAGARVFYRLANEKLAHDCVVMQEVLASMSDQIILHRFDEATSAVHPELIAREG